MIESFSTLDQCEAKLPSSCQRATRRATKLPTGALAVAMISFTAILAHAVPLPSCAQLAADTEYGLAGNAHIASGTLSSAIVAAAPALPPSASEPTPTPATPAYC